MNKKAQKKSEPIKSFTIRYRHTALMSVTIDARSEDEARCAFDRGDFQRPQELDSIDIEFESIKEEL